MLGESFPQVLAAARCGADWAWASVYRDLAPMVHGYLRGLGAIDPEDRTGEVFLQVVRDLSGFDGDERAFRSWVFVIAHRRLLDDRRRRARRPVEPTDELARLDTPVGDAEGEALRSMATDRVQRIIDTLAPDQRDVLLLRLVGGLTIAEVAQAVGKSVGAVKALQRRGLAGIQREISRQGVPL